jgi:hypothetical protein
MQHKILDAYTWTVLIEMDSCRLLGSDLLIDMYYGFLFYIELSVDIFTVNGWYLDKQVRCFVNCNREDIFCL